MRELEEIKRILGVGFAGNAVTAVEAQQKIIDDLKTALGLPQEASPRELQERISIIKSEHEEFMQKRSEWGGTVHRFLAKAFWEQITPAIGLELAGPAPGSPAFLSHLVCVSPRIPASA